MYPPRVTMAAPCAKRVRLSVLLLNDIVNNEFFLRGAARAPFQRRSSDFGATL